MPFNATSPLKHRTLLALSSVSYAVTLKSLAREVGQDFKNIFRVVRHYEGQGLVEIFDSPKGLAIRLTQAGRDRLAFFESRNQRG